MNRIKAETKIERLYRQRRAARASEFEARALARKNFEDYGEELRAQLPVPTVIAYAYHPREHATSNGENHIVVCAPFAKREPGDALCKTRKHFWGLTQVSGAMYNEKVGCLACLKRAERLLGKMHPGPRVKY